MRSQKKIMTWRLAYAACSLLYVAWVVHLSLHNFEMVHSDYRRAGERLQPARIAAIALQELVEQCRQEVIANDQPRPANAGEALAADDPCLAWPTTVLEERQKDVKERLLGQRSLTGRKLLLFYLTFGTIFLIMPPLLLYLLLSLLAWILRSLKFV